jgi:hypothetical protein
VFFSQGYYLPGMVSRMANEMTDHYIPGFTFVWDSGIKPGTFGTRNIVDPFIEDIFDFFTGLLSAGAGLQTGDCPLLNFAYFSNA